MKISSTPALCLLAATPLLLVPCLHAELLAYWSFEHYNETGDNPPDTAQGNHEG